MNGNLDASKNQSVATLMNESVQMYFVIYNAIVVMVCHASCVTLLHTMSCCTVP